MGITAYGDLVACSHVFDVAPVAGSLVAGAIVAAGPALPDQVAKSKAGLDAPDTHATEAPFPDLQLRLAVLEEKCKLQDMPPNSDVPVDGIVHRLRTLGVDTQDVEVKAAAGRLPRSTDR